MLTISLPDAAPTANATSALRKADGSGGGNSVASMCTESGIWEHVGLDCVFDPLAISLEDGSAGSLLDGWRSISGGGDGAINASMIATIAVLATLVVLSGTLVVVFFTHKK